VTDTLSPASGIDAAAPKGLAARMAGVIFSPGDTFQAIVAQPRVLGVLVITTILMAAAVFGFLSTEVGMNASLDQQMRMMESLRFNFPDEFYDQMEARAPMARYYAAGGILVTSPLICAVVAGIIILIFNVVLGGEATFKQAFAIVAHSQVLLVVQQFFILPLNYVRETMSSATTLSVFAPMLDEMSFLGRLLGWIDLFWVWWIVNVAIGAAVLYKRKSAPIAWALLGVYLVFALIIAAALTAFAGA
jgi:hypothetical protein